MITKIWYSVGNGGDGSAYPYWFESEELAVLDQDYMDEGWGECCVGSLDIEHEGPIKVLDKVITAEMVRDELQVSITKTYYSVYEIERMKEHLEKVLEFIEGKDK